MDLLLSLLNGSFCRKAPKTPRETKKFKEYVDVEPDPNTEDFFYDEVDQHNMDREKVGQAEINFLKRLSCDMLGIAALN